jgi:hypothetical protein
MMRTLYSLEYLRREEGIGDQSSLTYGLEYAFRVVYSICRAVHALCYDSHLCNLAQQPILNSAKRQQG